MDSIEEDIRNYDRMSVCSYLSVMGLTLFYHYFSVIHAIQKMGGTFELQQVPKVGLALVAKDTCNIFFDFSGNHGIFDGYPVDHDNCNCVTSLFKHGLPRYLAKNPSEYKAYMLSKPNEKLFNQAKADFYNLLKYERYLFFAASGIAALGFFLERFIVLESRLKVRLVRNNCFYMGLCLYVMIKHIVIIMSLEESLCEMYFYNQLNRTNLYQDPLAKFYAGLADGKDFMSGYTVPNGDSEAGGFNLFTNDIGVCILSVIGYCIFLDCLNGNCFQDRLCNDYGFYIGCGVGNGDCKLRTPVRKLIDYISFIVKKAYTKCCATNVRLELFAANGNHVDKYVDYGSIGEEEVKSNSV